MKTRILFVDDEEMALKGLDRYLRSLSSEWDMEFVDSGAKALARMAQSPFDVIVSDMRMPVMNGAELLNEVMKRYPRTVRLILSGYSDRNMILKCVGSTHQYLAKPCDGQELKMALQRARQLDQSLASEIIRKIITRCDTLPSVPAIYSKIIEVLQDPECDTETIGSVIVQDTAMTAKILKLVNSSFFGHGREIVTPSEAVAYLGTDTIKSLLLFENTFSQWPDLNLKGFSVEGLWSHSLHAANAARAVATSEGAERKLIDEAYIAGLLHDVGKLVLAVNLTKQYEEVLQLARTDKISMAAAERTVFGSDHADIGGYLLGLWGLPVPVIEAIMFHHNPNGALQKTFGPLTAVHAGNALISTTWPAIAGLPPSSADMSYFHALGLDNRMGAWRSALSKAPAQAGR